MHEGSIGRSDLFHARRLGHVNLFVSDLDRSLAFYNEVVGLEVVYVRPPVKAGFLSNGNSHHDIGLVQFVGRPNLPQVAGLNHLGIEVETELGLVDSHRRAVAAGLPIVRTTDHYVARAVYLTDPDGNQVEIYADTVYKWRDTRYGGVNTPTTPWTPGTPKPSAEPLYQVDPDIQRVENAPFHPRRITHAVLAVTDYAETLSYYTRVVGLHLADGGPDAPFSRLAGSIGETVLALVPAGEGVAPGLLHFNLLVADETELERSVAEAKAKGIAVAEEIDTPHRRGAVIADPDGIRIQFYVDRPGVPVSGAEAGRLLPCLL